MTTPAAIAYLAAHDKYTGPPTMHGRIYPIILNLSMRELFPRGSTAPAELSLIPVSLQTSVGDRATSISPVIMTLGARPLTVATPGTKLYLRNQPALTYPSPGELSAALPVGSFKGTDTSSHQNRVVEQNPVDDWATVGISSLAQTAHQDNYIARFLTNGLQPQTIDAGVWSFVFVATDATAANAFITLSLYVWSATAGIRGYIYDSDAPLGSALTTSPIGRYVTFEGQSASIQDGDQLVLEVWLHLNQSDAVAHTSTLAFGGLDDPVIGVNNGLDVATHLITPSPLIPTRSLDPAGVTLTPVALAKSVGDANRSLTPAAFGLTRVALNASVGDRAVSISPVVITLAPVTLTSQADPPRVKLYLRNLDATYYPSDGEKSAALPVGSFKGNTTSSYQRRKLSPTIGAANTSIGLQSLATAINAHQDNYLCRFNSDLLAAQTFGAGTWTFAFNADGSSASNAYAVISLYVWNPSSGLRGYIHDDDSYVGAKWAKGGSGRIGTFTGSNVTISAGDFLVLEVWADIHNSDTTAHNNDFYFNGQWEPYENSSDNSYSASYLYPPTGLAFQ